MIQPSWIETYPNPSVSYGFDETGLWFQGNADELSYPVRSNYDIPETNVTNIVFTFIHDHDCNDQGVCIFHNSLAPIWQWNDDVSRIAFQMNCDTPTIKGQNSETEGNAVLQIGQTYTGKMTYDPKSGVTCQVFLGTAAVGTPISVLTLNETLPPGPYRVGFDADSDGDNNDGNNEYKAYFTDFSVVSSDQATSCPKTTCPTEGFACRKKTSSTSSCACSTWKYYYAQCSRNQVALGICSASSGAYVPAITVCNQRLF